jgi:hypothetical protein
MVTPPKPDRGRVIYAEIRSILLHTWDPIGVAHVPAAQDEYDHYIRPVYDLLVSGATDKELTDYLFRTEIKTMGLTRFWMRRHLKPVVARLRKIDLSL